MTEPCAACGDPATQGAVPAVYVDAVTGRQHPHVLCRRCAEAAARSVREHERIAAQVELRLLPAEGRA